MARQHVPPRNTLDRRVVVPQLVPRHEDWLFVTGLGGTARDIAHLTGDGPNLFALGGAMGAAMSIGLGLALARPDRRVMVVTGDGEVLMGLGTLATIAVLNPGNLSILCVDNGHYGETGNQVAHTGRGTDLVAIAKGAGIPTTATVMSEVEIGDGRAALEGPENACFVVVRVTPGEPPTIKRNMDAAVSRVRMKAFLA